MRAPAQGKQREEQADPPPKKKKGGRTQSHKTADPQEATKPPSQTAPKMGPPKEHWRTSHPKRRHPTESSGPAEGRTSPTRRHTPRWGGGVKKKTGRRSPNKRGRGDGEHDIQDGDSQRRTRQSHDRTRHDNPPPAKEKRNQRGGGGTNPTHGITRTPPRHWRPPRR